MNNLVSPVDVVRARIGRNLNVLDVLVLRLSDRCIVHAQILLHDSFAAVVLCLDYNVGSDLALKLDSSLVDRLMLKLFPLSLAQTFLVDFFLVGGVLVPVPLRLRLFIFLLDRRSLLRLVWFTVAVAERIVAIDHRTHV